MKTGETCHQCKKEIDKSEVGEGRAEIGGNVFCSQKCWQDMMNAASAGQAKDADANRITIRPEVAAFAQAMEARLREKDALGWTGSKGWQKGDPQSLLALIQAKLNRIENEAGTMDEWIKHGTDIGNYAMMICWHAGGLR